MISADSRRWWALGALALSLLVVGLDATIINIALPTLSTALHASTGDLQWFADAYNLVFAAALLPAGLLGDRFGRKKVLLIALALFGAASAACAYAQSADVLIAARAVLGLGAACLMPMSLAMLPVLFSEEERPRAMGVWITVNAVSFPIGPIVGGWLLNNFWWGSVFLINVPVTIIGVIAVMALVPESRNPQRPRLDLAGVAMSSAGLVGLTYGFIEAGEKGWGNPGALTAILLGVGLLAAFGFWEYRLGRREPGHALVDLALFRSAGFTWGAILATVVSFALFGVLFAIPQFFQAVNGTDALGTGLRLLPIIVGLLVGAKVSARFVALAGAKVLTAIGFAFLALGLVAGATTGVTTGYGFAAAWITVIGIGLGFALPTTMNAALGTLSADRSGVGSALISTMRQVGGAIGVAILGTVLNSAYRDRLNVTGLPAAVAGPVGQSVSAGVATAHAIGSAPLLQSVRSAFVHGMDVMLLTCGGVSLLGIVLTLAFLPRQSTSVGAKSAEAVELAHEGAA
jgi:MFS transporter, DHA2 family, multidrug resistance protein